jgi:hypothetical protein
MDAQAIEDLGGILQIIGTGIVVVDLLAIYGYLGVPERLKTRLHTWRVRVEGWLRRLLRRRGKDVVVHAQAATAVAIASSVTVRTAPGPFVPQPDQPVAEQLAAHAEYLNRLHAWMNREIEQRDEAIQEVRDQARAELQAERTRVDGLLATERDRFNRLHKLMTNGIGLRWLGVLVLVLGTAFSTWPDGWAHRWPAWLSTTTLVFLLTCGAAAWVCWLIQASLRAADHPAP